MQELMQEAEAINAIPQEKWDALIARQKAEEAASMERDKDGNPVMVEWIDAD